MSTAAATQYDLFVSYAADDHAWVEGYVLDALHAAGVRYISESAFTLGAPRLLEFERAIQQSTHTLLILSPAYIADDFAQFADLLAQYYGLETSTWPVIPLIYKSVILPRRFAILTSLDATDEAEWAHVLERLCVELQRPTPKQSPRPPCPYPGMVPFRLEDAHWFYGRQTEIQQMVQHLYGLRTLLVVGPSGSGKSSLINAGLLPALMKTTYFPPNYFLVRTIHPGYEPMEALSHGLMGDPTRLVGTVRELLAHNVPYQKLLLVVDQMEELWTQASKQDQDNFVHTLMALREIDTCTLVILIRSDFFYSDLMNTELRAIPLNERFEILPLSGSALREAIEKPAESVGVYIEQQLLDHLLHDSANQPGILPLIQETMKQLWDKMERRLLRISAYESLGGDNHTGLVRAIESRANAVFNELTLDEQVIARRIFLRLIQFGEGRADTRRQQPRSALVSADDNLKQFDTTLYYLTENRLLTLSSDQEDGDLRVDIAHEQIFYNWSLLHGWITEYRGTEQTRRQLEIKTNEWERLKRRGGLLDTVELREAEDWLSNPVASIAGYSAGLVALIDASRLALEEAEQAQRAILEREISHAQKLVEAERLNVEMQKRAAKRLRRRAYYLGGALITTVLALVMTGILWIESVRSTKLLRSQLLLAEGQRLFDEQPLMGLRLAIEGLSKIPTNDTQLYTTSMQNILDMARQGRIQKLWSESQLRFFKPDYFITADLDTITVWKKDNAQKLFSMHGNINDVIFDGNDHKYFVINYHDRPIELRRLPDGEILTHLHKSVSLIEINKDNTLIVMKYEDRSMEIRNTYDGNPFPAPYNISNVYFSKNIAVKVFAIKYENDTIGVYRIVGKNIELLDMIPEINPDSDIIFSNDTDSTYFTVQYENGQAELRRSSDGSVVLSDDVRDIVFSDKQSVDIFVVIYDKKLTEIRRISDNKILQKINGNVSSISSCDVNSSIFFLIYRHDSISDFRKSEIRNIKDASLKEILSSAIETIMCSEDTKGDYVFLRFQNTEYPSEIRKSIDGETLYISSYIDYEAEVVSNLDKKTLITFTLDDEGYGMNGFIIRTLPITLTGGIHYSSSPERKYFSIYEGSQTRLYHASDNKLLSIFQDANYSPITKSLVQFTEYSNLNYFLVNYSERSELWVAYPQIRRLLQFSPGAVETIFVDEGRKLIVAYSNGSGYLIDIPWIESLTEKEHLSSSELLRLVCKQIYAGGVSKKDIEAYTNESMSDACQN